VPQVVMSEPDYKIVNVRRKDTEKVLEHLRTSFFREEPLNICIKLLGENWDEDCLELEQYCSETIPEGIRILSQSVCQKVLKKEFRIKLRTPIYKLQNHINAIPQINYTRWFKYDRDCNRFVYTQIVPVIFEPPCSNIYPCPSCYGT